MLSDDDFGWIRCRTCDGDGLSSGPPECRPCRACKGSGRVAILLTEKEKTVNKKNDEKLSTNPDPTLFSLHLEVGQKKLLVSCNGPGFSLSGSGDFETVAPLLNKIIPELEKVFKKGAK